MRSFVWGFVAAIVIAGLIGYAAAATGAIPARADVPPSAIEKQLAQISLNAIVKREAPQPPYPFPSDAPAIVAGAQLYVRHCSVCHGTGSSDGTTIAKGLYIAPPQFAKHGVDDDPAGETYWKIEHGIRWTGMPAYGGNLTEQQIWQMAYFLATAPEKLPADAKSVWDAPLPEPFPTLPPGVTMPPMSPHHAPGGGPDVMGSPSTAASPSAAPSPTSSGATTTTT